MKKQLSALTSAALALTLISSAALAAPASKSSADFSDLASLDTAAKAKYDTMIASGVFDGVRDGFFGLNERMNRAQFAKVAALIFGLNVDSSLRVSSFSDVSASDPANGYALPYIEALKAANLTDGFGPGTYNPAGEVTKEQLAAFLLRGLGRDAQAQATPGLGDGTVSAWAKGYAALALQLNLLPGQNGQAFGGTTPATRDLLVTSSYEAKQLFARGGNNGATQTIPAETMPAYALNSDVQAQVQSVFQDKTADGWKIGVVVKLNNTTGATVRVPDHELRVKTAGGTVYTLPASATNVRSILPQSSLTLSYMSDIDVKTDLDLTNLLWIDVNQKVYPKQETVLADAPIAAKVWRGKDAVISDTALLGGWGASFSAPNVTSGLKYAATDLTTQYTGQQPTYLVQVKVTNTGSYVENVPDFTLGGKAAGQLFVGKRVEEGTVAVKPGETTYVHYAITTDSDTALNAFYVLSPETFVKPGTTTATRFYTGRIGFRLPASTGTTGGTAPAYTYNTPMTFQQSNTFVNPNLAVSLVELHVTDNAEAGNKTGLAKFKLINNGDKPIPVPALDTELVSKDRHAYAGVRQTLGTQSIAPGSGSVVSYAFTLPSTESGDAYTLNVQGVLGGSAQGQQTYKTTIASYGVTTQPADDHNHIALYPFTLNMKNWTLSQQTASTGTGFVYTYKLNLDLDVVRAPEVEIDNSFSKLKFELVDATGVSLGSNVFPFNGANRLVSGYQTLNFPNLTQSQLRNNISVKVYEVITTPSGEVSRFLTELK